MTVVTITFGELVKYAIANSFIIAGYKKNKDGDWAMEYMNMDGGAEGLEENTSLFAGSNKNKTMMIDTVTQDKVWMFKLHSGQANQIVKC